MIITSRPSTIILNPDGTFTLPDDVHSPRGWQYQNPFGQWINCSGMKTEHPRKLRPNPKYVPDGIEVRDDGTCHHSMFRYVLPPEGWRRVHGKVNNMSPIDGLVTPIFSPSAQVEPVETSVDDDEDVNPDYMQVPCPRCRAFPGERCVVMRDGRRSDTKRWPHRVRHELVEAKDLIGGSTVGDEPAAGPVAKWASDADGVSFTSADGTTWWLSLEALHRAWAPHCDAATAAEAWVALAAALNATVPVADAPSDDAPERQVDCDALDADVGVRCVRMPGHAGAHQGYRPDNAAPWHWGAPSGDAPAPESFVQEIVRKQMAGSKHNSPAPLSVPANVECDDEGRYWLPAGTALPYRWEVRDPGTGEWFIPVIPGTAFHSRRQVRPHPDLLPPGTAVDADGVIRLVVGRTGVVYLPGWWWRYEGDATWSPVLQQGIGHRTNHRVVVRPPRTEGAE